MEINLRINQLIDKLGYTKSGFAAKIGVSQPIITHITTGRNNPGLEVIQKILTNCPEINPEWLILEKGEMILNNQLKNKLINDLISDINESIIKAENEVILIREKAEMLKKMILEG